MEIIKTILLTEKKGMNSKKHKLWKRLSAVFIVLCMVFTIMPMSVLAFNPNNYKTHITSVSIGKPTTDLNGKKYLPVTVNFTAEEDISDENAVYFLEGYLKATLKDGTTAEGINGLGMTLHGPLKPDALDGMGSNAYSWVWRQGEGSETGSGEGVLKYNIPLLEDGETQVVEISPYTGQQEVNGLKVGDSVSFQIETVMNTDTIPESGSLFSDEFKVMIEDSSNYPKTITTSEGGDSSCKHDGELVYINNGSNGHNIKCKKCNEKIGSESHSFTRHLTGYFSEGNHQSFLGTGTNPIHIALGDYGEADVCAKCNAATNFVVGPSTCVHTDANNDGICDKCGKNLYVDPSTCVHTDANNDGICDKCGKNLRGQKPIIIADPPVTTSDNTNNKTNNTQGPKIEGENGASGWDNIVSKISDAKDGETITVDMGGTTIVPETLINKIKGKDVNVVLDMGNGIKWTINGKDVTNSVGNIDLGVTVGKADIPNDVVNGVANGNTTVLISLNHSGEFGFKATLTIDMQKENAGKYANLYYYNPTTKQTEFMASALIKPDGTADIPFSHASDYVIVVNDSEYIPGISTTFDGSSVKLTWDVVSGATSYNVYYVKDGKWVKLKTTSKTALTVNKLTNNKTYKFMVRAKVGGKLTTKADSYQIKVKVCYKPVLKASVKDSKITLKWSEVNNATKYGIYKRVDGEWKLVKMTKKLTLTLSGAKPGKSYKFAVRAYVNGKWTKVYKSDLVTAKAK